MSVHTQNKTALELLAGEIAKHITDEDVAAAIGDARRALKADKIVRDERTVKMVEEHKNQYVRIPDEGARARAREFIIAYAWGKPTEKSINLNFNNGDGSQAGRKLTQAEIVRSLAQNIDVNALLLTLNERSSKQAEQLEPIPCDDDDTDAEAGPEDGEEPAFDV